METTMHMLKQATLRPGMTMRMHTGFALVEALIAVLIFCLGVLALMGLQAMMSKNVTQSRLRGEASILATQLIGQMWVDQANLPNYAMAGGVCATSGFDKCTSWRDAVGRSLPRGSADVSVNGSAVAITLKWTLPGETEAEFDLQASVTN
jgi:type IV pilus assembly protein PilV